MGASAKAAAVRVSVTRSKLGRLARADTITVGRARRAVGSCARSVSRLRRSANHLRETLDSRARTRAEGCQVYNRVGPMRPAIVFDVKRIRSPSSAAARFRIFTRSTSTGPIPVWRQVSAVVSLGCHTSHYYSSRMRNTDGRHWLPGSPPIAAQKRPSPNHRPPPSVPPRFSSLGYHHQQKPCGAWFIGNIPMRRPGLLSATMSPLDESQLTFRALADGRFAGLRR